MAEENDSIADVSFFISIIIIHSTMHGYLKCICSEQEKEKQKALEAEVGEAMTVFGECSVF